MNYLDNPYWKEEPSGGGNRNNIQQLRADLYDYMTLGNIEVAKHSPAMAAFVCNSIQDVQKLLTHCVVCPDWNHKVNTEGKIVYTMDGLGDGIPQTALVAIAFMNRLSDLTKNYGIEAHHNIHLTAWESYRSKLPEHETKDSFLSKVNASASRIHDEIDGVNIVINDDPSFFEKVVEEKNHTSPDNIIKLVQARQSFYRNAGITNTKEAAKTEIGEALTQFDSIPDGLLLVSTSPVTAQIALGILNRPYIQLLTGYVG